MLLSAPLIGLRLLRRTSFSPVKNPVISYVIYEVSQFTNLIRDRILLSGTGFDLLTLILM